MKKLTLPTFTPVIGLRVCCSHLTVRKYIQDVQLPALAALLVRSDSPMSYGKCMTFTSNRSSFVSATRVVIAFTGL